MDSGRDVLATNLDLVRRVHELARLAGRGIMTSQGFRTLMGMKPGGLGYGAADGLRTSKI
jgi:uncharacterized protein (DUF849 family)